MIKPVDNAKHSDSDICPVWQPVGYSTHQISKQIGNLYRQKASHTGTLDPLAEGVIIILLGEERFKKYELAGWKKTYEFEIAFGLGTDSYDAMGMIRQNGSENMGLEKNELGRTVAGFIGEYVQKVPLFSATRYQGKRLFVHARSGMEIPDLPEKKGTIYKIELLDLMDANLKDVVLEIIENLNKIVGDFRQDPIIEEWKNFLKKPGITDTKIQIAKVKVVISRGMYVRSLSQDIAKAAGVPGFVTSLTRTGNGMYTKKDCKTLEELFGKNYGRDLFVSTFTRI